MPKRTAKKPPSRRKFTAAQFAAKPLDRDAVVLAAVAWRDVFDQGSDAEHLQAQRELLKAVDRLAPLNEPELESPAEEEPDPHRPLIGDYLDAARQTLFRQA